jgi:LytR cell envelope-related transcriptional attenuator
MAQSAGGTVLEEPPPGGRRARRKARADRSHRRGDPATAEDAGGPVSARQARRQAAERRRFWFVLMPTVAVLMALTVVVGAVIRANDDSADGSGATGAGNGSRRANTLLVSHRDADGRLDLLVLTGTDGQRAAILLVPTATQVEVPSLGPETLADIPNDGDPALLTTTIENLLGVRVVKTVTMDDAALTAALAKAAPIPADLHRAVQFDEATGDLFAAGSTHLTAEDATQLLVRRQSGSELDRLVTVQDVLDGWLGRLRNPRIARATVKASPELAGLIAVSRARDRRTDSLPVESVTTGGGERFEPRIEDVERYVSGAFPNARLGGAKQRPRVEILNGTGAVGLAQSIAGTVVPAGGQVTLTGNVPNFGVTDTQVVYYRDADRADAQRLLDALDCGALKKARRALGVVDVTIVAGADCFRTGDTPGP